MCLKIALFTEIYDCGGVDTFIVNLINHWPYEEDSFVIIANANYPGLRIVENNVSRPCEFIRHTRPTYANSMRDGLFQKAIRLLLFPISRYLFICWHVLALRNVLLRAKPDVLLVINGGYPGGDSCRAAGISWGLFSGKPHSVHNFHNIVVKSTWLFRLQELLVDAVLCRYTFRFVTVSRAACDSMALRPVIYRKNMTTYIHNGIAIMPVQPETKMNIRDEIGIAPATPLCLMLGTYEPRKGHYFLFRAFNKVLAEIPDAHLLICGFGFPHEIRQVKQYVKEFKLDDRVHLMDFRTDSSHLYAQADILVVASQEYESFGFTCVEAMAHRLPVVATNAGGIPEVVVDGEGGYCVDRGDADAYAQTIVRLLRDRELRKELGRKGYERYQKYFTAERMSREYADLLHLLVSPA
jgi:glycosyltransferase involved in cell wall biosynthesis